MFRSYVYSVRKALVPSLVLLLSLGTALRAEDKIVREFTRELNLEPGRRVVLENSIGEVKVNVWEKNVLQIRAWKKCDREWFDRHGNTAEKSLDRIDIEITESSEGVQIKTNLENLNCGHKRGELSKAWWLLSGLIRGNLEDKMPVEVVYEIMVPSKSDLDLNCDIGKLDVSGVEGNISVRTDIGEIIIQDVRGQIFARNDMGEINVVNSSGSVDAKTSMGEVNADISSLGPLDQVQLESSMGQVSLKLPADAQVDISANCGMGGIDNSLGENFLCRSRNGDLNGSYNGGGASVCLKSGMGAINIASR